MSVIIPNLFRQKQRVPGTLSSLSRIVLCLLMIASFILAVFPILIPIGVTASAEPSVTDLSSSSFFSFFSSAKIKENGRYSSKEDVALYIHTFGHLPSNYVTKAEARKAGWESGSLELFFPGCSIGGDVFQNREKLLPEAPGRKYFECDIDTAGQRSRGSKRIVYSNDGLIYYTEDRYESFTLLYGNEDLSPSAVSIQENGSYDTKDEVALYIHTYGHLPNNYVKKSVARRNGWDGGSLDKVLPGCSIGGDVYRNLEESLPVKRGRTYYECDIGTTGRNSRGAKRIVFSNDGLIYYTDDHYETFILLYGEE